MVPYKSDLWKNFVFVFGTQIEKKKEHSFLLNFVIKKWQKTNCMSPNILTIFIPFVHLNFNFNIVLFLF